MTSSGSNNNSNNPFERLNSKELRGHPSKVYTVGWNSDGSRLASGSSDSVCRVWNIEAGESVELKGHSNGVDQLCWHPSDPQLLATAASDKTVRIWDTRARKPVKVIDTQGENINIAWSPDGNSIAVGNKDNVIAIIDAKTYSVEKQQRFEIEVNEFTWNNLNNSIFLTTGSGKIEVLEYPSMKTTASLNGHTANCYCIDIDPKGRYLATGGADAITELWDLEYFVCIRTFTSMDKADYAVRTLGFTHDGEYIATGSEEKTIEIYNVATGEKVHQPTCHAPTYALAWHPKRYMMAIAGDDTSRNLLIFGI